MVRNWFKTQRPQCVRKWAKSWRCHPSGVMRWRRGAHCTCCISGRHPEHQKRQMVLLVNETNVSEGTLRVIRWERRSRLDSCLLSALFYTKCLKLVLTRVMRQELEKEDVNPHIWTRCDLLSLLRAFARSSVRPVSSPSCSACGGPRMPGRLAPSPGLWLPTPVWVSFISIHSFSTSLSLHKFSVSSDTGWRQGMPIC